LLISELFVAISKLHYLGDYLAEEIVFAIKDPFIPPAPQPLNLGIKFYLSLLI
jgi:hypothetical protein